MRELETPLGRFVAQMISDRAVAQDVLQDTFYVAWRERSRMPASDSERRAWFYGVARNQALQALRKGRRGRRALDAAAADRRQDAAEQDDSLVMRDLLVRLLAPKDRSLFVLRYVHGFSAQALAEMTDMRPTTVRKRLERSASTLRSALAQQATTTQEACHGQPTPVRR